jgi:diaminohydroxyphosphoribosylaminopyrimidine deaminase / 5-amino-6-(5-phosphoribosylamino)uracil reductase
VDARDIHFMEHALALAVKGIGVASPNPTVGCVIVRDGEVVGEGFHQYDWQDHAEITALKSAGEKARGATLHVSLEPCDHTGRTGPCTEAIIAAGIRRVVAGMEDPNPATSGRGFERLRAAAIEVQSGLLEHHARRLNESFACWIRTKKPFVTLKAGLTLDGQLAMPGPKRKSSGPKEQSWITSEESRAEVHRMRHASDALLTGSGTVLSDDPFLTDRSGLQRRRRLLRVVLDSNLRLPPNSRLVKTADDDLLVFTAAPLNSPNARRLQNLGVEVVRMRTNRGGINLSAVVAELGKREILSVLLEGGPTLNGTALRAGIVHKLILFYAPKIAGDDRVPFAHGAKLGPSSLQDVRFKQFGPDFTVEAYLRNVYEP